MNFLINTSNLKVGGGIQVADSIIRQLSEYKHHRFIVILSKALNYLKTDLDINDNCKCLIYNMPQNINGILCGKNKYLDDLVKKYNIDAVFTVFGPSLWRPKVKHLCGFARPQLIYPESPFFEQMGKFGQIKSKIYEYFKINNFKITSDWLVTESPDVSSKLKHLIPEKQVYTITNNYNQIYNQPEKWKSITLEPFDGLTLLTISANHPHKNLKIIPLILEYIDINNIPLNVRFVVTLNEKEIEIKEQYKDRIIFLGKVNIETCPCLFQQADYMFLPTLLECFSASYPEAMKMRIPIITSDLPFAHSLCGKAAIYVNSLSPKSIVNSLLSITDEIRSDLVNKGIEQLNLYDTAEERCSKVIKLLEIINQQ